MAERLKPNAPRFHALLERKEGRSIFILSRQTWEGMRVKADVPVLMTAEDLSDSRIATAPSFIAATARHTGESFELSVFRIDLEDHPNLINADIYDVWDEMPSRINVANLIVAASTSANANFQRYLGDHVFLVKRDRGPGHHLPSLPEEVLLLLKQL